MPFPFGNELFIFLQNLRNVNILEAIGLQFMNSRVIGFLF